MTQSERLGGAGAVPNDQADIRIGAVRLAQGTGLHARPVVRLTQCAKTFGATVEVALSRDGPWTDAKSPAQMMRLKAPPGTELVIRTAGQDASAALHAMLDMVRDHANEG